MRPIRGPAIRCWLGKDRACTWDKHWGVSGKSETERGKKEKEKKEKKKKERRKKRGAR